MNYNEVIEAYKKIEYPLSGTYEKLITTGGITNLNSTSINWTGNATVTVNGTPVTNGQSLNSFFPCDYLVIVFTLDRIDADTSPTITDATVTIDQGVTTIFSGIVGIPTSPMYSTTFECDVYALQVQSINAILRRRLLTEAWQNKTTTEIVQGIFDNYIQHEGIALGKITDTDFTYDYYVSQRKYIGDVLDELIQPIGATWHISTDKKFYFVTKEDFVTMDAPKHISALQKTVSGLDTRTVQAIAGAKDITNEQTQEYVWQEDQSQLFVDYEIEQKPEVKLNGWTAGVGILGIEDEDTSISFLWSKGSQAIKANTNAIVQPATGDTVTVKYIGTYKVEIEESNQDKIMEIAARTGTSGRIEKIETDSTIKAYSDGQTLAKNLLDKYSEANETVTCVKDDTQNAELLTVWTFDLPNLNVTGDYIITQRVITKDNVTLTLSNKNYFMKYGSIYNGYDKNIRRLSVGETTKILKTLSKNESLSMTDEFKPAPFVFYPTVSEWSDPTSLIGTMEVLC